MIEIHTIRGTALQVQVEGHIAHVTGTAPTRGNPPIRARINLLADKYDGGFWVHGEGCSFTCAIGMDVGEVMIDKGGLGVLMRLRRVAKEKMTNPSTQDLGREKRAVLGAREALPSRDAMGADAILQRLNAKRDAEKRLADLHKARREEVLTVLGTEIGMAIEIDGAGALSVPRSGDINMLRYEARLQQALDNNKLTLPSVQRWTPAPKAKYEIGEWGEGNKRIEPSIEDWERAGRTL